MSPPNLRTGLLAATGVLFVWSGFIIFGRAGVLAGLTPYDLVAGRFIVAGALILPFTFKWWPRHLPVRIQVALALVGPGAAYSLLMFTGLGNASAAYAGVFANGALPLFTMVMVAVLNAAAPKRIEVAAASVIILGGVMVGWSGLNKGGKDVAEGIVMFLIAASLVAGYLYLVRQWKVTPQQGLVVANVPNALIFVPLWFFFLPSTMMETDWQMVAAQMLFQGLGPGVLALMLFTMAAYHLGPTPMAMIAAAVPATATLLAIPVLAEVPTHLEWGGIVTVTLGLGLMLRAR